MKAINDFFKEIESSVTLSNELKAFKARTELVDFLKKYDVDATAEEFEKACGLSGDSELGLDELEGAAGGAPSGGYSLTWPRVSCEPGQIK